VVRDLAERVGLRVVAVGERSASSAGALRCIDEGADDYLSTRATSAEWVARVRAVVRRRARVPAGPNAAELRAGDLTISLAQRQVWRDGTPVKLTRTEFSLLEILARHIDTPWRTRG
jgi:DNA-binding response OmpR family regulator